MNLRILAPLVLATSALLAQAPRPTPEHQRLAFWVGHWKGEWVARENPFGFPLGTYPFTMRAEFFPGNFHVLCRYEWAASGPMGAYSDLDILGYDPDRGRQVLFVLDSFGTTNAAYGTLKDRVWSYKVETLLQGKPIWHRFTATEASPRLCTMQSEYSWDGQNWIAFGEGRMTRE